MGGGEGGGAYAASVGVGVEGQIGDRPSPFGMFSSL